MTTTIRLREIFRQSWREVSSSWRNTFQALWLPALILSIFQFFSHTSTMMLIFFIIVSVFIPGFVGASWLLKMQDKKNAEELETASPTRKVGQNFLIAWILLFLMSVLILIVTAVVSGGVFWVFLIMRVENLLIIVSFIVLCILVWMYASSYVMGRCGMVLPASLEGVQERRFRRSWRETATCSRQLTWFWFMVVYALPFFVLGMMGGVMAIGFGTTFWVWEPELIFGQEEALSLGTQGGMNQTVLTAYILPALVAGIYNIFTLLIVLFLISGLFYVYDTQQNYEVQS